MGGICIESGVPGHNITKSGDLRRRLQDLDRGVMRHSGDEFAWDCCYEICPLNGAYCSLEVWYLDGDLTLVTHRRQGFVGRDLYSPEDADADVFESNVLWQRERLWETLFSISDANKLLLIDCLAL